MRNLDYFENIVRIRVIQVLPNVRKRQSEILIDDYKEHVFGNELSEIVFETMPGKVELAHVVGHNDELLETCIDGDESVYAAMYRVLNEHLYEVGHVTEKIYRDLEERVK